VTYREVTESYGALHLGEYLYILFINDIHYK